MFPSNQRNKTFSGPWLCLQFAVFSQITVQHQKTFYLWSYKERKENRSSHMEAKTRGYQALIGKLLTISKVINFLLNQLIDLSLHLRNLIIFCE